MDHYERLGVNRNASHEDLKKAYRNMSKKTHPDAGGDADEFNEVRNSYLVLSDPDGRDEYDRTGTTKEKSTDKTMDILGGMMDNILERSDVDETTNIVQILKSALSETIIRGKIQIKSHEKEINRLRKIETRFKKKVEDGDNLFQKIAKNKSDSIQQDIDNAKKDLLYYERALTIAGEYWFDFVKNEPSEDEPWGQALGPKGFFTFRGS